MLGDERSLYFAKSTTSATSGAPDFADSTHITASNLRLNQYAVATKHRCGLTVHPPSSIQHAFDSSPLKSPGGGRASLELLAAATIWEMGSCQRAVARVRVPASASAGSA
eukprot:3709304-Prymnesium_polylepis.1